MQEGPGTRGGTDVGKGGAVSELLDDPDSTLGNAPKTKGPGWLEPVVACAATAALAWVGVFWLLARTLLGCAPAGGSPRSPGGSGTLQRHAPTPEIQPWRLAPRSWP